MRRVLSHRAKLVGTFASVENMRFSKFSTDAKEILLQYMTLPQIEFLEDDLPDNIDSVSIYKTNQENVFTCTFHVSRYSAQLDDAITYTYDFN